MKPKPFRLHALLEHRLREKDEAALALATAIQRHAQAVGELAALDERAARAKASIACGAASQTLRDGYAVIERMRVLRPRAVENVTGAANERDRRDALHREASRAWKVVAMLNERAQAAQAAYAENLEEWELGESNLGVAARAAAADS